MNISFILDLLLAPRYIEQICYYVPDAKVRLFSVCNYTTDSVNKGSSFVVDKLICFNFPTNTGGGKLHFDLMRHGSNNNDMSLYSSLFVTRCTSTFHLTPREWQVEVGARLIQSSLDAVPIRHLCVRPTGGGKSLVFNTVADVVGGVTICICPLLSLGADQAKKILSKTETDCRSITAFHLDELSTDALKKLKDFFQST